jgi:hypothetical protein
MIAQPQHTPSLARWLRVALVVLLVGFASMQAPASVWAQSPQPSYQVDVTASARRIEIGESLELTLTVEIVGPRPSTHETPRIDAPAGWTVIGPSTSFSSRRTVINGRSDERSTLRATFRLVPTLPGRFVIPSPTITMSSRRLAGLPVEVEVVEPAGGTSVDEPDLDTPSDGGSLALAAGPSEPVFLRAIADRTDVVVGEQITVSYYLYFREAYEMTERTEPQLGDFLRYGLLTDPASTTSTRTRVAGRIYGARLVDRVALVPLRTGKLSTGKLAARFNGRRIGARVLVESNELFVEVREPPEDGRPLGYRTGDVGRFELRATVQPRAIPQGGTVAVRVRVEGDGNLPNRLDMPQVPGGEWLEPSVHQQIAARFGRVGGQRSFDYLLRLRQSGSIDLGTLRLPSWDPDGKSYVVTETRLGSVEVEAKAPTPEDVARARARDGDGGPVALPRARTTLGSAASSAPLRLPLPWLALGLALPPGLVLLGFSLGATRRMVARWRASGLEVRRAREAQGALRKLERRSDDPKERAAAALRALHASLEARLGRPTRGLVRSELELALEDAGVEGELGRELLELVDACEAARYAPAQEVTSKDVLGQRVHDAIARLGR